MTTGRINQVATSAYVPRACPLPLFGGGGGRGGTSPRREHRPTRSVEALARRSLFFRCPCYVRSQRPGHTFLQARNLLLLARDSRCNAGILPFASRTLVARPRWSRRSRSYRSLPRPNRSFGTEDFTFRPTSTSHICRTLPSSIRRSWRSGASQPGNCEHARERAGGYNVRTRCPDRFIFLVLQHLPSHISF